MSKTGKLERKSLGEKVVFAIAFLIFLIYATTLIFPFAWGLVSSLKTPNEYYDAFKWPAKLQFGNYVEAFKSLSVEGITFMEMVWNSVWFAIGSTVIHTYCTAATSYVLARYEFRGKKLVMGLFILVMSLPVYGAFPAQYRLYHQLHLVDSYLILLTAFGAVSMNMLLMIGYYKNMSGTYAESAKVDGAGPMKTFHAIMMPQAKPFILTVFMFDFISSWNNYLSPMLYLPSKLTLATGLYMYQEAAVRYGNYPMYFAAMFVFIIPVVALYLFLNRTIMENLSIGGIKG